MRRTARALVVAALAGVAVGTASAASAQTGPGAAETGGGLTASASCAPAPTGGGAPDTVGATPPAFEPQTLSLGEATGGTGGTGDAGRDGAGKKSDGACSGSDGQKKTQPWTAQASLPPGGDEGAGGDGGDESYGGRGDSGDAGGEGTGGEGTGGEDIGGEDTGRDQDGRTDGGPGDDGGRTCDGTESSRGGEDSCGQDALDHGVEAGAGTVGTASVPALAAGGVLIAGAFAAAAHRLAQRRNDTDG
ncbi:hypothetical protein [Streptomyces sp. V3I7]|uniref:hypothetical protein n=1 Tax=Streptomyces sp. V3I7 TaxID=3042278 RepID=UPI0027868FBC|nr:hypothetical protein [Streptomyces sp. V3I7]MDQ0993951.1 hypothetical protein [Streptomyces sp. V3I7]